MVVTPEKAPLVLIGNVRRHRGVTTDVPLWPTPATKKRGPKRQVHSTGSRTDQRQGAVVDVPAKEGERSPPGAGSRPKAKGRGKTGNRLTTPLNAVKSTLAQE